ncbi:MAG: metal-dependent hydrolase [Polyangiales bacterium]
MSAGPLPEVRNLQFAVGAQIPRYWHGGRKSLTAFFNNLSVFFPEGERFFILAVKAHKDKIKDPKLAAEARAFYAQEGIHSREHVRYNEMLREQGYPIEAMEGRIKRLLGLVTKRNPPIFRLGVTAALEHFTALMADFLLGDPRVLAGADPVMADLWKWHAAEENEHKAVAFDVFKAAGGSYRVRMITMIGATLIFWAKVFEQQVRMMKADGILWNVREWFALANFLFGTPGSLRRLIPKYFDYFKRDFHPWDHDNNDLLEAWRDELARTPGYGAVA